MTASDPATATTGEARRSAPDSTVDGREVEFYATLADRWWDASGPFWPLHRLNELRADYLRERLAELSGAADPTAPLKGLEMVDIGCGGGILSESMSRLGAAVTGIDVVAQNLQVARLHARTQDLEIDYRLATAAELVDTGASYDVVLNMEVVEHVADVPAFLRQCCALLRPGGIMAVATINRTLLSYLTAILGAEYVLGWLPRGTHRWRQFRTPREIKSWLAAYGMRDIETVGVRVNPVNRRFALTRITAVNYMQLFKKDLN